MQSSESKHPTVNSRTAALLVVSVTLLATSTRGAGPQEASGGTAGTPTPPDAPPVTRSDPPVELIDEFGAFEIAVEDVPLPQVLNMLAVQSRRNIITS
ncbi:MAG: hypothetical protein VX403_01975, partial [Planctomycetota bacterium]|nr:hypothetical protein [Planctomycetota bacterium]